MHPLLVVALVAAVAAAFCWIASLVSGDASWVDRLWSVMPVAYLWIFAAASGLDARLVLMAVLVTLWGARLTVNFARKGGYTGAEDYRWPWLRARLRPWQWHALNLVFVSAYQHALLVLIALPALTAYEHRTPLGPLDVVLAVLFLASLAGETVADQQQWDFHQGKKAAVAAGRDPGPGFLRTGLWRYSRHPNFFFEQAQWWIVFLFGAVAAGSLLQWTVLGAVLLTLLFLGSTALTEHISASKYPEYAGYRATTSMLVPLPPRRPREAAAAGR